MLVLHCKQQNEHTVQHDNLAIDVDIDAIGIVTGCPDAQLKPVHDPQNRSMSVDRNSRLDYRSYHLLGLRYCNQKRVQRIVNLCREISHSERCLLSLGVNNDRQARVVGFTCLQWKNNVFVQLDCTIFLHNIHCRQRFHIITTTMMEKLTGQSNIVLNLFQFLSLLEFQPLRMRLTEMTHNISHNALRFRIFLVIRDPSQHHHIFVNLKIKFPMP
mmetsp:Transcript_55510/g.92282  ORF Transcript_55510/g.92282 Transcript_55510/m.92282 type:complete len:215 (+) Transcript_55510:450-1094(+)